MMYIVPLFVGNVQGLLFDGELLKARLISSPWDRTTLNPSTIDVMVDSPSKKQKPAR